MRYNTTEKNSLHRVQYPQLVFDNQIPFFTSCPVPSRPCAIDADAKQLPPNVQTSRRAEFSSENIGPIFIRGSTWASCVAGTVDGGHVQARQTAVMTDNSPLHLPIRRLVASNTKITLKLYCDWQSGPTALLGHTQIGQEVQSSPPLRTLGHSIRPYMYVGLRVRYFFVDI